MKRLAFGFLLLWSTAVYALGYTVHDLPAIGGSLTVTTGAYDISEETGWVAGYSGAGSGQRAVRWGVHSGGAWETRNLGVLPSAMSSVGYGVNIGGDVVGSSGGRAFAWIPWMYTGLHQIPLPVGAPPGMRCVQAYSINHVGEVVGRCSRIGTNPTHWAFHWRTGEGTTLFSSFSHTSLGTTAYDINKFGQFVGSAERRPPGTLLNLQQAYVWQADPAEPGYLGAFSGQDGNPGFSVAYGLNEHMHVVGESEGLAFLWKPLAVTLTPLDTGVAKDINNLETIVGYSQGPAGPYAWVKYFNDPMVYDLNLFIPANSGWRLLEAHAVNDRGWIVGIGSKATPTGGLSGEEGEQTIQVVRGFLLIPQ